MIKARISKNMRGTIMLPTVSSTALPANKEVFFNDEQFYAADIQGAIQRKLLVVLEGEPSKEDVRMVKITVLSFGSVLLPGIGIIRSAKTIEIPSKLLDTDPYRQLVKAGLISVNMKLKTGKSTLITDNPKGRKKDEIVEEVDPSVPANMQKGRAITVNSDEDGDAIVVRAEAPKVKTNAKKTSKKDAAKGIKRVQEESLLIDPSAPDAPEEAEDFLIDPRTGKKVVVTDDVTFVDHEQTAARMNPRLRNK